MVLPCKAGDADDCTCITGGGGECSSGLAAGACLRKGSMVDGGALQSRDGKQKLLLPAPPFLVGRVAEPNCERYDAFTRDISGSFYLFQRMILPTKSGIVINPPVGMLGRRHKA